MKPLLSNKLKSQLIKIFWISVVWTFISISQFLIGLITVRGLNCDTGDGSIKNYFIGSILTGVIAGVLGGGFLVLLWEKWLRQKNYGRALFDILWSFTIVYIVVSLTTGAYARFANLGLSSIADEISQNERMWLATIEITFSYTYWLFITVCTLIVLQVNDKYGPGVFGSFLLGKYFQPTREERIFMFLDLRSSTTIAEKLGEVRYFNFIKNIFKDVTPAILNTKGEIYQYVGDEIVISWKMKNGLENSNCLQCFFDVQSALKKKHAFYESKFDNIMPEFKAGLHYGNVMAGEVGVVKRDIAYSGDVLNTTARIQSKCNDLGVNILLSKFLMDQLPQSNKFFNPKKMGDLLLRGKEQKVTLYTV